MRSHNPICRLLVENDSAWELDHDVPVLWPWFFEAGAITESRRLHTTLFDGAARFQERLLLAGQLEYFRALPEVFEEIRPDLFPRAMGAPPDAVLSLDLSQLEARRPYRHEEKARRWREFFAACREGDQKAALPALEQATLSSLRLTGHLQRDAIHLAARAREQRRETTANGRQSALIELLMGSPASRPARALHHGWVERAGSFPPARFTERPSPLRGLVRRFIRRRG